MTENRYLTAEEAGIELGITQQHMIQLLNERRVKDAGKCDGRWVVPAHVVVESEGAWAKLGGFTMQKHLILETKQTYLPCEIPLFLGSFEIDGRPVFSKPRFLSWCGNVEEFEPEEAIRFDHIIADPPWNVSVVKGQDATFLAKL